MVRRLPIASLSVLGTALAALALLASGDMADAAPGSDDVIPGHYIVVTEVNADASSLAAEHGARPAFVYRQARSGRTRAAVTPAPFRRPLVDYFCRRAYNPCTDSPHKNAKFAMNRGVQRATCAGYRHSARRDSRLRAVRCDSWLGRRRRRGDR